MPPHLCRWAKRCPRASGRTPAAPNSRVLSGDGVPANQEHVRDHARPVQQRIDSSSGVVSPAYGDFHHAEAKLIGEEENLRIESPAFDTLQGKHSPGRLTAKGLESALGVFEIESQQQPEQQVEDSRPKTGGQAIVAASAARCEPSGIRSRCQRHPRARAITWALPRWETTYRRP